MSGRASHTRPKRFALTAANRYFRLDSYKSHWNKCHKDQEWVIPQTRKRFKYLWQEFCELNDKRPIFITPSSFLQIAPGLDFPRGSSIGVAPPSALLAPDADTPTVPMRLAQAPAQMERVENSLDFFGQDLLASTTPLSATTVPILFHPPSAYNNTVTPIFFPSAFDHTYDSRYTPIGTPVGSRSSSVSTSSVPIPDVFISGEASHQLQSSLEPFGAFDPGFCPSQADDQDCGWKTFETYFPHRLDTQIDDYLSLLYSCSSLHSFGPT